MTSTSGTSEFPVAVYTAAQYLRTREDGQSATAQSGVSSLSITVVYPRINSHIISFTSPILNSGARDTIFQSSHHTMSSRIYVCSLQQSGTN